VTPQTLVPYSPRPELTDLSGLASERVVDRVLVKRLVLAWHSTHPPRVGWKVAFLLRRGATVVGVSVWGLPTARREDNSGRTWEHYRMALSSEAPRNAASFFLARNRAWIRAHAAGVTRLIAYIDETVHTGVTYRADNWRRVACDPRGRPWKPTESSPGRKSAPLGKRAKFERRP
jgi:hypothetical protein